MHTLVEMVAAIGSVLSAVAVIFHGGRQIGRVEAAIAHLTSLEKKIEGIPALETRVQQNSEFLRTISSEHRELRHRVDRVENDGATMRGRLETMP